MEKTYKVIFKGKRRGSSDAYARKTLTVNFKGKAIDEKTGVLPQLNESYDVYEIYEIWEKVF